MRSLPIPLRIEPAPVSPLLLTVERSPEREESLATRLGRHGVRTLGVVPRIDDILNAIRHEPHVVLLDRCEAEGESLGLLARLRTWTLAVVVVLIRQLQDSAALMDAGADDFLVRPYELQDVVARARVWFRMRDRVDARRCAPLPISEPMRIEPERRTVIVDGREVHITPIESRLLMALALRGGKPMTEQQVQIAVWGSHTKKMRSSYLRACVRQLQHKLELDPSQPRRLLNDEEGSLYLDIR